MKAKLDAILHREQAEYVEGLLPPSDDLIAEMERHAAEHHVPIADREVALFLEITARQSRKRALDWDGDWLFRDSSFARYASDGRLSP